MAVGEEEEEPLDLYIAAVFEKLLKLPRSQIRKPLHQHVGLMEALVLGQFAQQFEDRALRR